MQAPFVFSLPELIPLVAEEAGHKARTGFSEKQWKWINLWIDPTQIIIVQCTLHSGFVYIHLVRTRRLHYLNETTAVAGAAAAAARSVSNRSSDPNGPWKLISDTR